MDQVYLQNGVALMYFSFFSINSQRDFVSTVCDHEVSWDCAALEAVDSVPRSEAGYQSGGTLGTGSESRVQELAYVLGIALERMCF